MKDPVLNLAIYIIWWWLAFFVMLPLRVTAIGAADASKGHDAGAPRQALILKKALWAAGAALVLWAITFAVIRFDPFHIRT
jgi:predicted secreted protein